LSLGLIELTIFVGVVVVENPLSVLLEFLLLSRLFLNMGGVLGTVTSSVGGVDCSNLMRSRVSRVVISGLGSEANGAVCLNSIAEFSNSDLTVLVGVELGDPCLGLGNISNNDASIVVALDVVPKLLGLRVVKGLVLIGVIVGHDPVSNLLNLLVKLINSLNSSGGNRGSEAKRASFSLKGVAELQKSDLSVLVGIEGGDP
jgi:hypothetical protein